MDEHALAMIGLVVVVIATLAAVVGLLALIWNFMWSPFGPMLQLWRGEPLRGELAFYRTDQWMQKENGYTVAKVHESKDHAFDVPWYFALVTRRGHFLLGFMRLRRQSSPTPDRRD